MERLARLSFEQRRQLIIAGLFTVSFLLIFCTIGNNFTGKTKSREVTPRPSPSLVLYSSGRCNNPDTIFDAKKNPWAEEGAPCPSPLPGDFSANELDTPTPTATSTVLSIKLDGTPTLTPTPTLLPIDTPTAIIPPMP
jgi:hypothetical protein